MHIPTWLYHKTKPAKVFHTKESVEQALKEGWVDTPAKLEDENANLGSQTQSENDKKQNETSTQPTPGENQTPTGATSDNSEGGSQNTEGGGVKPIDLADFANKTNAQLIAFLVEKGHAEKELKKLKKDQLIARIGELGK